VPTTGVEETRMGKLDHDPVKDETEELNEADDGDSESEDESESEDSGDEFGAGDSDARRTYVQLLLKEGELIQEHARIRSENEETRAQIALMAGFIAKTESEEARLRQDIEAKRAEIATKKAEDRDGKRGETIKGEQCGGSNGGSGTP
jgi:hypothetical protein